MDAKDPPIGQCAIDRPQSPIQRIRNPLDAARLAQCLIDRLQEFYWPTRMAIAVEETVSLPPVHSD